MIPREHSGLVDRLEPGSDGTPFLRGEGPTELSKILDPVLQAARGGPRGCLRPGLPPVESVPGDAVLRDCQGHRTAAFPIEIELICRRPCLVLFCFQGSGVCLPPSLDDSDHDLCCKRRRRPWSAWMPSCEAFDSFKEEGGKFAWTVHNVMPHESTFHDLEVHLRQELADRADLVHIMCEATVDEIGDLYRLPPDRTLVLPHSSYIGVYPDAADRQISRDRLGVDPEDVVVLALGGIRPYKGLDRLLEAFERAVRRERRLRLVVAGKTWPFAELDELSDAFRSHPRVIANFNEILPTDLQHFYKASDVAVIPQRVVLNSGALLLAYTFGLPVIAPRSGCVAELLDDRASMSSIWSQPSHWKTP